MALDTSSVQATERWSLLVVLTTWQVWLARSDCLDHPLSWQRTQDNLNLAPGRVAQLESVLPQDFAIQQSKNEHPDLKSPRNY